MIITSTMTALQLSSIAHGYISNEKVVKVLLISSFQIFVSAGDAYKSQVRVHL